MNITLSLLKLGFSTPSWPEPSLSDDLEKDQKYFLVSRWLGGVGFNGKYMERDLHLWMVFNLLSIKQPAHCVIKHHAVSMTDTTSLLSYVITQNQNMSRTISCSTPAELSVKLIIHKFTGMWSRRDLAARYCANAQKHKYTNTQIHKYKFLLVIDWEVILAWLCCQVLCSTREVPRYRAA